MLHKAAHNAIPKIDRCWAGRRLSSHCPATEREENHQARPNVDRIVPPLCANYRVDGATRSKAACFIDVYPISMKNLKSKYRINFSLGFGPSTHDTAYTSSRDDRFPVHFDSRTKKERMSSKEYSHRKNFQAYIARGLDGVAHLFCLDTPLDLVAFFSNFRQNE